MSPADAPAAAAPADPPKAGVSPQLAPWIARLQPYVRSAGKATGRTLAVLGGGAVMSSLLMAAARWQAAQAERRLPEEFLLELDLSTISLVEGPTGGANPLDVLRASQRRELELRKLVHALDEAGRDVRCRGLLAKLGAAEQLGGMAMIQETRDAVLAFRRAAASRPPAGKKGEAPPAAVHTVALAPSFGEAGSNGSMQYYLASCFDKVFMQPSGQVGLLGLLSQHLFLRPLLDRAKLVPLAYTRERYKTALHDFTESGFTLEHREQLEGVLKSLASQIWRGVSAGRNLPLDQVHQAVAQAPLMAAQASAPAPAGPAGSGAPGTVAAAADGPAGSPEASSGGALSVYPLVDGLLYLDQVLDGLVKSGTLLAKQRAKARQRQAPWWLPPPLSWLMTKRSARPGEEGDEQELVDPKLPRLSVAKYLAVKDLSHAAGVESQAKAAAASSAWGGWFPASWSSDPSAHPASAPPPSSSSASQATGKRPRTAEAFGWVSPAVGKGKPKVAVVHATGGIVQGPVLPGAAPPAQKLIDATRLSADLRLLAEAQDVKAVVLRVSSPGGSALGSDTLHHAISRLRQAGKRVVVSCGDVAASGGMFLAVAGDHIVASPGTLMGSIGVIVGKLDARGLLKEIGVNPASVEEGSPNLTTYSFAHGITPSQDVTINALMDSIYDDFLAKVAAGRKMSVEQVRKLAGGRVYTGEQALEVGLVDELGGLSAAVRAAKKLAGLPHDEDKEEDRDKVVVFEYPPRKVPFLLKLLQASLAPSLEPSSDVPGGPASASGAWLGHAAMLALDGILPGGGLGAALQAAFGAGGGSGQGLLPKDLGRAASALQQVVATFAQAEGVVLCYSPDADVMARTLS